MIPSILQDEELTAKQRRAFQSVQHVNDPAWWVGLSPTEFYAQCKTRFPADGQLVNGAGPRTPVYANLADAQNMSIQRRTA